MAETRADQIRQERRYKPGAVEHTGLKLTVPEEMLDRKTFDYRFVNDTPGRISSMERKDWDVVKVDIKPDSANVGTTPTAIVGTDSGKPINAVLMRKRKDWNEEDQKAKQERLNDLDRAIMSGQAHSSESDLQGSKSYTPNGRNQITSST